MHVTADNRSITLKCPSVIETTRNNSKSIISDVLYQKWQNTKPHKPHCSSDSAITAPVPSVLFGFTSAFNGLCRWCLSQSAR